VLLGKLNMDEFAMGSSGENSSRGSVRNPYDHTRAPGGSSSGSAAACAAGLALATLGTDTGGSIRQPAAFCGLVGLKPTYGRISRSGIIAFASSLDQVGPLTRNVADSALLLSVLAGEDPQDATSAPVPVPDYPALLGHSIQGLRLGLPREYFGEGLSPEVAAGVKEAVAVLEGLGATVIPISGGNTDRQIMVMRDFGVTAVCCTPSYFLHLIERAGQLGVDIRALPLRAGVFGAEPWTASMRKRIESAAGIKAFDIYGLSEIIGPGVAVECPCQDGLHIFEDHFYPEIVDPETGRVLPEGEEGELVLTTLSKWAMPMIRYRTRDITSLVSGACPCGRSLRRMRRIGRRSDDMLILRGVNVFPSQVEAALLEVEGTLPHYQIILTREQGLDQMEVQVEVTPETFSDQIGVLERLNQRISDSLDHVLGIRAQVTLVEPHTIQRSEGKARRVIDRRTVQA